LRSENVRVSKDLEDEKQVTTVLDAKLKQLSSEAETHLQRRQALEHELSLVHKQLNDWKM
jgi:hypothetical protein